MHWSDVLECIADVWWPEVVALLWPCGSFIFDHLSYELRQRGNDAAHDHAEDEHDRLAYHHRSPLMTRAVAYSPGAATPDSTIRSHPAVNTAL